MLSNLFHNQNNILFVALLCLLQTPLFCQQLTLHGQIKDAISQEKIPYSTVQNINEDSGVFADSLGVFEIQVKKYPVFLVISSVGYQTDTLIVNSSSSYLSILLKKDNNLLPTVEIVARQKLKAINDKTYFPHNFVIWNNYVFLLSKRGTFGNFQIEVFDVNGELFKTHQLDLGRIDDIKVNCLDKFFISNKTHNINLDYTSGQFIPLSQMLNSDYETLFKNCTCQDETNLFYEFKLANGLIKKYVQADKRTGESALFKEIREEQRLENYKQDLAMIQEGNSTSNMGDINAFDNKRIRRTQSQGDFMEQVFYKNFKENYVFKLNDQLVLFNHEERKIEFFGEQNDFVSMTFADDKDYIGLILVDKMTQKIHAAFNVPKGIALKEVNLRTGQTEREHFLEIANFEKIRVQNDVAFVLGVREGAGAGAVKSFFIKKLK
ncbi:MAG: hypothetical protein ACI85O_001118 [Saprospiraceae bacterium]|jgi:hypothetical protein